MIELEIENLAELQERFAQSPLVVGAELEDATKKAGIGIIKEEVKQAPHDSGKLQQSIKMEYTPIEVSITPDIEYAKWVVSGTRPHTPPRGALEAWARRHGVPAVMVQRAISKRGTKPNPFVQRTRDAIKDWVNDLFKIARDNIVSKL